MRYLIGANEHLVIDQTTFLSAPFDLRWYADVVISPAQPGNHLRRLAIAPAFRWRSVTSAFWMNRSFRFPINWFNRVSTNGVALELRTDASALCRLAQWTVNSVQLG
jgi:hypothetical protein